MITEERFQKLSSAQWLFHFHEAARNRKHENQKFKALVRQIEAAGIIAHPKTDRAAVVQKISERDLSEQSKDIVEDLVGYMNEVKDIFPETIDITTSVPEKPKFFLPTYARPKKKRPRGVVIGEEPQDGETADGQLGQ